MRRELGAGLALGSILGSIGFMRITIWSSFSTIHGPHWLLVAFTIALALVGVVLWGTLVGSLLPFVLGPRPGVSVRRLAGRGARSRRTRASAGC